MPFDQDNFAPVGAVTTAAPTVYSYITTDDLATVKANGYFAEKSNQLSEGDSIYLQASDGADILGIDADLSTGSSVLSPQDIFNRVVINDPSDFPDSVGGVIPLPSNIEYYIGSQISVSEPFEPSGPIVFTGAPGVSSLNYSGSLQAMFKGADLGQVVVRDMILSCPNVDIFDISDVAQGTTISIITNCQFVVADGIGVFNNTLGVNITNSAFISLNAGVVLQGLNTVVSARENLLVSTNPAFIGYDLGSSTSPTFEIINQAMNAPSGAVGISGAANNANILAGSIAAVSSCEFLGGMTALSGITTDDYRWLFIGNSGVEDSNPDALISTSGNALETAISVATTPVLVNAVWVEERASQFTSDSAGRITYPAERPLTGPVDISATIASATGSGKVVSAYFAKNGTFIASAKAVAEVGSNDPRTISIPWQISFDTGDYIEMFVANDSDTTNLIVTDAIMRVR